MPIQNNFWAYFISEPIFKMFASLITTCGLQNDDIFILKNAVSERWCTDNRILFIYQNIFFYEILNKISDMLY